MVKPGVWQKLAHWNCSNMLEGQVKALCILQFTLRRCFHQGNPGCLSETQVRFHVSVHKSGSLTHWAWPSAKLTLIAHVLGSGSVRGQSRGARSGGLAP